MNGSNAWRGFIAVVLACGATGAALAREVNIYSSRHYASDEAIYAAFTKQTGIAINRKEGKPEELLQLILAQGAASPADVFITVDAGNIWKAEQAGVLAPFPSKIVATRVPTNFRDPQSRWFGVAKRLRLIFVDRASAAQINVRSYDDLADPRLKGTVCIRQSSAIYNLSLLAARIEHEGPVKALAWTKGVVANFARAPQGGDTDQLLGIGSGECKIAVANHYYYLRLIRDPKQADIGGKIQAIFPDQDGRGVHANITGAGLLRSGPNQANAKRLLEFLVSDEAQGHFANLTNEYPIVESVPVPAHLAALGPYKTDPINVRAYGEHQPQAQKLFDQAGWK
jgi:iron(III) transport system substrate-binding protein